jgi:hypothetical protein
MCNVFLYIWFLVLENLERWGVEILMVIKLALLCSWSTSRRRISSRPRSRRASCAPSTGSRGQKRSHDATREPPPRDDPSRKYLPRLNMALWIVAGGSKNSLSELGSCVASEAELVWFWPKKMAPTATYIGRGCARMGRLKKNYASGHEHGIWSAPFFFQHRKLAEKIRVWACLWTMLEMLLWYYCW